MSKRWDVVSRRPGKDKAFFHRIGTAFEGEKGISLKLDSLPLPDEKGEVWLNLYEPRERDGQQQGSKPAPQDNRRMGDVIDDDIPF